MFEQVQGLKLMHSFKSMRLHLWDEGHRRLVGFKQARLARRALERSQLSKSDS